MQDVSVLRVLLEAALLRVLPLRLRFYEYFDFSLFATDLSFSVKRKYGGAHLSGLLSRRLVDSEAKMMCHDKVTMYALLRGHGLPVPAVIATYRCERPHSAVVLRTRSEAEVFLRNNCPLYIKPAQGCYGVHNVLAQSTIDDQVVLGSGSKLNIREFLDSLENVNVYGWIFQEPLTAHSSLAELTGTEKISGLRIETRRITSGIVVAYAVLKLNAGSNDVDNFGIANRSGNFAAAVDIHSGTVTRVVSGVGYSQRVNPPHPQSARQITGFAVPHWQRIVDLVIEAHKAFPGLQCPGWDVAICEDGPRILEVNTFGDPHLFQFTHRRGFMELECGAPLLRL